ncbi:MAG: ABC transporter permease [Pseudomonadota bacterium]
MLGPLAHTVWKELLVVMRDPASRVMMVAMPLLQLLVFAFAASMEVRNVQVLVVNDDTGYWSREFIARVEAANFIDEVVELHSLDEVKHRIDRRDALLAMHFQADFSRDVVSTKPARVQLILDGRRANTAQVAEAYLQNIAGELQLELVTTETSATPPEVKVRNWFNPNLEYRWFIVPALITILAFLPALSISILSVARDRELGTLDQLVVSPVTPLQIILGKALPAVIAGMIATLLVLALAVYAFRVPFTGSISLLLLSQLIYVFSAAGLGLAVSASCDTQQQALIGMFVLSVPLFVTSGFVSPVANMPQVLQWVSEMNPLMHSMVIIQGCFLKAISFSEAWRNLWPMIATGMVTMSAASLVLRWRIH